MIVGSKAMTTTMRLPKYLPKTICHLLNGLVCKISNVPVLNSSAKLRMVMAGMSNNNIHGASWKNLSRVAYPKSRILFSKTKSITPFTKRKTMMAI